MDLAKDASWGEPRKLYVTNIFANRPMILDGVMVKYPIGDFVGTVQYAVVKTKMDGDILLAKKSIPYDGKTIWCISLRLASNLFNNLSDGVNLKEIEGDPIAPEMNAYIDDRNGYHVEIMGDRGKYYVVGKYLSASVQLVDRSDGFGVGVNMTFDGPGVQSGVDGSTHTNGPVSFNIYSDDLNDGVHVLPCDEGDSGVIDGYLKSTSGVEFWYSK
jgi:hypothetical protein